MTSKIQKGLCYSPAPPAAYGGWSPYLDAGPYWNLAYLSFPYEKQCHPQHAQFNIWVRRSAQARLDGGGPDLVAPADSNHTVGSLLMLPAPRFVYLIKDHAVLPHLQLFQNLGYEWLSVIEQRAWVCESGPPFTQIAITDAAKLEATKAIDVARRP